MEFEKTAPLTPPIGRYRIIREIGRGTMGIVYEAFDPVLERGVALKTVRLEPGPQQGLEFKERFQREAKSAARLNHPNIVTIHDAGEEGGVAYIAMEFLEGKTLRCLMDEGRLTTEEAVNYAIQIAEGLDYAHRFGIIHRDIKPDNIIVSTYGRAKITDFGIAQLPMGNLTQTGALLGTPKYMSPEQIRGERLDGRADIFSLGVILYEMLTGKPPFAGDSLTSTMYKILQELPVDPPDEQCPAGIRQILARSLAKDKEQRYAQGGEMAADLRQYPSIVPDPALMDATFGGAEASDDKQPAGDLTLPSGRQIPPLPATRAPADRRKPLLFAGAGAFTVLLAGIVAWSAFGRKPTTPPLVAKPAVNTPSPQVAPVVTAPPAPPAPAPIAREPQTNNPPSAQEPAKAASAKKPATKHKAESRTEAKAIPEEEPKPRKGFWRRQIDCIRHGLCDKPAPPVEAPRYSP
ncbi:MAG: serine/threonine-protein kinase [Betaproteobacteria bacterium]